MKRLILTFVIAVLCGGSAIAQGLGFGLKGGVNISNTNISADQYTLDTNSKIGFHGGVFLVLMFSEKLGVQPELLYSMQGSKYDIPSFEGELKLDYITIPVLLRYNINDMISLHAGPQFGILTKAEEEYDGDTGDIKDDFKGSDVSGAFGLEVDLPAKLGFGARYVFGLSNVLADDGSFGDATLKNGTIQVYLKFRILGGN